MFRATYISDAKAHICYELCMMFTIASLSLIAIAITNFLVNVKLYLNL